MTARQALWGLVAASTLLRLALAASLGPGNDEAYYSLFALHPDWSYFDQPPMLAIVEGVGMALARGATSAFALRLGFIALFAGSTLLMTRLTTRFYGPWAGVLAAFSLNVTGYYGVAAGTFVLPDGPLLFFWLLTLDRLASAIATPGRLVPWIGVGLAWGGALLSKYHAVFLPVGTLLYLIVEPSARYWLRRPGPYLALALGMALFSPVIGWNAAHGWASFAFQGGRAVGGLAFRPDTLAAAVGGQAIYLFPWVWLALLRASVRRVPRLFEARAAPERFLACQAVPPLATFLAVACLRPVLPHWSLVGLVPLFPILGRAWAERSASDLARWRRRLVLLAALPVALTAILIAQARWGLVAATDDPTLELFGWDQVARELHRRGLTERPEKFLFTSHWCLSGQLAFATRRDPAPVLCYSASDSRGFAYWSRPEHWVGRDGILVAINDRSTEPDAYDRWFTRIEPIGEFPVVRAGVPVRKIRLFRCVHQTRAFPFGGPGPRDRARAFAQAGRMEGGGADREPARDEDRGASEDPL